MGNPGFIIAELGLADSRGYAHFHAPGEMDNDNNLGYRVHIGIDIFVANQTGHR
jgi:hypothetical protein